MRDNFSPGVQRVGALEKTPAIAVHEVAEADGALRSY
jgi:hypothetical protein